MLSDRSYIRDDYQREGTSFLLWMLSAIIAGFVVQNVFAVWLNTNAFERLMALSEFTVKQGFVWTFLTYPLLHGHVLQILGVGLGLYFLGRELRPHITDRKLIYLTLAATVIAACSWLAIHFGRGGNLIGATSILCCYLVVFACLFPNREISFLVFFILPVTTRPKYIAWVVLGLDLCGFLFAEIPGGKYDLGIPHSAHLGAMLAGWLYFRYLHESDWNTFGRAELELPRWMKRPKSPPPTPEPALKANSGTKRPDIRAEVDRILDKINSHGFGALTPEEKRLLDDAKDLLSRR